MALTTLIFTAALLLITTAAIVLNAFPSSLVALLSCAALVGTIAVAGAGFKGVQLALFTVDLALLLGLSCIVSRVPAIWPAASAGLQLVTVIGHLAAATEPHVSRLAYGIMVQWMAWPSLVVLASGIVLDRRAGRTSHRSLPRADQQHPK